jgi:hypothetical protein
MLRRSAWLGLARDRRQYSSPVRIVVFNTAEGWARDVTEDIAAELAQACADPRRDLPSMQCHGSLAALF